MTTHTDKRDETEFHQLAVAPPDKESRRLAPVAVNVLYYKLIKVPEELDEVLKKVSFKKFFIYHSSVWVDTTEIEYNFGQNGIYEWPVRDSQVSANGFRYLRKEEICRTFRTESQVSDIVKRLGETYTPNSYDPVWQNCHSFSKTLALELGGKEKDFPEDLDAFARALRRLLPRNWTLANLRQLS